MTHLRHPVFDGTVLGVVLSLFAAAAPGWAVAYRIFGPAATRRHNPRRP